MWRYKDLVGFWSQPHHNRIGGVRASAKTGWVPMSKPIWLTELGCGAVDKGPNAPNAFGDPKSSEDQRPPFSGGTSDPLIQRQALRACHEYWREEGAHNPVSPLYGGRMLDGGRIYLWCWDARPYPAFPGMPDVWSDASNYRTGHWLNGRLGGAGAGEILRAMAKDFDVPVASIDAAPPMVLGLGVEAVISLRDASSGLVEAMGLAVRDRPDGIAWQRADPRAVRVIDPQELVAADGPVLARKRSDPSEMPGRLTLSHFDRERDYQTASVLAVTPKGERNASVDTGLVIDPADASLLARALLGAMRRAGDALDFALPASLLALEAGDLVTVEGLADGPFRIEALRDGDARRVTATGHGGSATGTVSSPDRDLPMITPPIEAVPAITIAHLPRADGETELVAAAFAEPWPGAITLTDGETGSELARLLGNGVLGVLAAPLDAGPMGIWDRASLLEIEIYAGHLASADPLAVLAASNRLAVQTSAGHWELIGFAEAGLIGPARYRLDGLLRGLRGTRIGAADAGSPVLVLDSKVARMAVPQDVLGGMRTVRAYAGPRDGEGMALEVAVDIGAALPLAPAHLRAIRDESTGDILVDWRRRSRIDGNGWPHADVPLDFAPESYRIAIRDGETVLRSVSVDEPVFRYSAAAQADDFGGPVSAFGFSVEQISPVLGAGQKSFGEFP